MGSVTEQYEDQNIHSIYSIYSSIYSKYLCMMDRSANQLLQSTGKAGRLIYPPSCTSRWTLPLVMSRGATPTGPHVKPLGRADHVLRLFVPVAGRFWRPGGRTTVQSMSSLVRSAASIWYMLLRRLRIIGRRRFRIRKGA